MHKRINDFSMMCGHGTSNLNKYSAKPEIIMVYSTLKRVVHSRQLDQLDKIYSNGLKSIR